MTSFDCYRLFLALNNHFFQNNYDYFKYKGSVPVKQETFDNKRADEKHRYERLSKKFQTVEELENFFVANLLVAKKRMWVGVLFGGESDDVYIRWLGRTQSLQYNLVNELKRVAEIHDGFNVLFKSDNSQHPFILKAHMRGDISLESFVLLDLCIGFIAPLENELGDDRNWLIVRNKAIKYRPFLQRLNMDIDSLRTALRQAIEILGVH